MVRVAFMGTPDFAVPALNALRNANHDIVCVYSQPPRRSGRGQKITKSAVQKTAEAAGLEARCPESFTNPNDMSAFVSLRADCAIVAAYGLILPKELLEAPRLGCINIHASLLPRWRGAAPIQRAILAGDKQTGVTIMQMDEGLDTGAILTTASVAITENTTSSGLHDQLATLGGQLIINLLAHDLPAPKPQGENEAVYASKVERREGRVDWMETSVTISRRVRALNPWPGVWCEREGQRLRILSATPVMGSGNPGSIIGAPLIVACGSGALRLDRVQKAGKKEVSAAEYVNGNPVDQKTVLQ